MKPHFANWFVWEGIAELFSGYGGNVQAVSIIVWLEKDKELYSDYCGKYVWLLGLLCGQQELKSSALFDVDKKYGCSSWFTRVLIACCFVSFPR